MCVYAGALLVSCTPMTPRADDAPQAAPGASSPRVLRVGPREALTVPSAAARVARDGDTIEIEAGIYASDAAVWRQHRLTIRGVGGRAHIRADGAQAEGKGTWIIKGNDATVLGVEFSGAKVPDNNGAAIRLEGRNLTLRDCYFHDNENGILTSPDPASDVVIEHSEFAHNGSGDGLTHNIYIGKIKSFTLRYSYSHHAHVGHLVKSRAIENHILYNRLTGEDGDASYEIDLPQDGLSFIIGNLIQQGPNTGNSTLVSYGEEFPRTNGRQELYVINNTLVNDHASGTFLFVSNGTMAYIVNNIFLGPGTVLTGPGESRNNVTGRRSDFVDPSHFDYRLKARAAAVGRGMEPGSANGISLRPAEEYVHKAQRRPRSNSGKLDAGALEYRPDDRP